MGGVGWGLHAFSQVKVSHACLVVNFTKIMFLFSGVSLKEDLEADLSFLSTPFSKLLT